jgi:hypothetical protein
MLLLRSVNAVIQIISNERSETSRRRLGSKQIDATVYIYLL